MWKYAQLPEAFGGDGFSTGIRVTTEEELLEAIRKAVADTGRLYLIEAVIPGRDCSTGLERLGNAIKNVQGKS
jgi:TPP-dependent 2-oxoacid decarboxylase